MSTLPTVNNGELFLKKGVHEMPKIRWSTNDAYEDIGKVKDHPQVIKKLGRNRKIGGSPFVTKAYGKPAIVQHGRLFLKKKIKSTLNNWAKKF